MTNNELRVINNELDKAEQIYTQYTPKKAANAASSASMISMIFRFFLQSGEYSFFIRRLKNVVANNQDEDPPSRVQYEKPREIISIKNGNYPTISHDETKAFTPSY